MIERMTDASSVRELADELSTTLLTASPFAGSMLGLREYDSLVPDATRKAEDELAAALEDIGRRAASLAPTTEAERVTLAVIAAKADSDRQSLANLSSEYTVAAMPITGPPALFATAARTTLADEQATTDYLTRLRGSAKWLDDTSDRLREGAAKGQYPVGSLVDQAMTWADAALATPVPPAFTAPQHFEGFDGEAAWRSELEQIVSDQIMPAVGRWRELLTELRPNARTDEQAGVGSVPGDEDRYRRAIAVHTTLPCTAEELHQLGLDEVARLSEQARVLGAKIGLNDLAEVLSASRAASAAVDAQAAIEASIAAIRRAEERAHEMMPAPLPEPCTVSPMPETVGASGMPPHYTPPRKDGSRPGTYWFNTMRPTAGTGWDLEAVAFHEAVPGHHSQVARTQLLPDLPLLQQLIVTAHAEGWGLYAERLAGEFGLYSGVEAEIGATFMEMHRAARLVVDTGLHAFGWSRQRAIAYLVDHVALDTSFLTNEVDRYIAWPGQALAYLVGLREILSLREQTKARLGAAFDLPAFNAAVLDSGSVPLPVLRTIAEGFHP